MFQDVSGPGPTAGGALPIPYKGVGKEEGADMTQGQDGPEQRLRPRTARGARAQTWAALDHMLAGRQGQEALEAALEQRLQENPLRFFRQIVRPLLPRKALRPAVGGVVKWEPLVQPTDGEQT